MKTQYSRRDLYAMGEPLGESVTRMEAGRRVYGGGGGITGAIGNVAGSVGNAASNLLGGAGTGGTAVGLAGAPSYNPMPNVSPVAQTDQQQGIATYAQPYVNTMLGATMQNIFDIDPSGNVTGMKGYNPYSMNAADYVAGFSPLQQQVQNQAAGMQIPSQIQGATDAAQRAIQQAQGASYSPVQSAYDKVNAPNLQQYQMGPAQQVSAPSLQQYQMGPAERVTTDSFRQPGASESFMSPYMQNVVDIQKREAQRASNIAGQQQQAEAVGRGAFGGSRDAIMRAERARNLATQLGDIQATGSQAAFQNAQQQFNAEQNARLQAQLANQQAGISTGLQNLNALLGVQQLGAGQNLQAQLANQQAGLTTGQQNLAAQLGIQQLGSGQNLQAQLANQQAQQQANQLAAQQQQFGANYGLSNLQQQLAGAGLLGNLGTSQLAAQQGIMGLQNQLGQQQQQQQQNIINQAIQNYQTAQQYPMQQLGQMKSMLQGLPISTSSSQQYQAAPSMTSQLAGLGIAGLGLGNLMGGGRSGSSGSAGGGNMLTNLLNGGAGLISSGASKVGDWASSVLGGIGLAEGGQIDPGNTGLAGLGLYNAMNK